MILPVRYLTTHFRSDSVDAGFIDRANSIQQRITQLRDSL